MSNSARNRHHNRSQGIYMAHCFEIYLDDNKEFRARFRHKGEIIWWTEGYTRKQAAQEAIESVLTYAPGADIKDHTLTGPKKTKEVVPQKTAEEELSSQDEAVLDEDDPTLVLGNNLIPIPIGFGLFVSGWVLAKDGSYSYSLKMVPDDLVDAAKVGQTPSDADHARMREYVDPITFLINARSPEDFERMAAQLNDLAERWQADEGVLK